MPDTNGSGRSDRLDRVEGIIEALANRQSLVEDEFARLLRAQVVMGDHMNQLTVQIDKLSVATGELAAAQKHTDARLDALILTVDEVIRGRKRE